MAKIALLGHGRMGKLVEKLVEDSSHDLAFIVGRKTELEKVDWKSADVAIDFSLPDVAENLCRTALTNGLSVVSGTTGWNPERLTELVKNKSNVAFLHATNLSIGMNAVFAANKLLARILNNDSSYTAAIQETHHVHKLDKPSGTAVTLTDDVVKAMARYNDWELVDGEVQSIVSTSVQVAAIRSGEVFGDHQVTYENSIDHITLTHHAKSRAGFARGALVAAEYLLGKSGVFTMAQVLGI